MIKQQIGVIGLGVMGMNLALNIESKGYAVSVYDYWTDRTEELSNKEAKDKNIQGTYSIEDFVASLETPRKILLMIKAGDTTDSVIQSLIPHLQQGDILIDGGNSYYQDTNRRTADLKNLGSISLVPEFLVVKKELVTALRLCLEAQKKLTNRLNRFLMQFQLK